MSKNKIKKLMSKSELTAKNEVLYRIAGKSYIDTLNDVIKSVKAANKNLDEKIDKTDALILFTSIANSIYYETFTQLNNYTKIKKGFADGISSELNEIFDEFGVNLKVVPK